MLFKAFVIFEEILQKDPPTASKRDSREARMSPRNGPGGPRTGPTGSRIAPRRPQELPGAAQDRPKSRPSQASERSGRPNGANLARKSSPEASMTRCWPSGGAIFHPPGSNFRVFPTFRGASSKLSSGQRLCKHTASIARRPCVTSACGLVRRRTRKSFA